MKNSPQEYAEMLIDKHYKESIRALIKNEPDNNIIYKACVKCAIIDVKNTLDALVQVMPCESEFYKYHFEALTILKSKL